jgi:molecular chaperone GrpE
VVDETADAPETPDEPTGLAPVEPPADASAPAEEVEALRRERDDLRDQLLRRRADFENYRKRVERDRAAAATDVLATFIEALIPSLDNLDRALSTDAPDTSVREGVELIRREIQGVLESHGVSIDDPAGRPFDPEVHQALAHEPAAGYEDGAVVEVFRKGYSLRGRLLRPALVKVAKGPSGDHDDSGDRGSDTEE